MGRLLLYRNTRNAQEKRTKSANAKQSLVLEMDGVTGDNSGNATFHAMEDIATGQEFVFLSSVPVRIKISEDVTSILVHRGHDGRFSLAALLLAVWEPGKGHAYVSLENLKLLVVAGIQLTARDAISLLATFLRKHRRSLDFDVGLDLQQA